MTGRPTPRAPSPGRRAAPSATLPADAADDIPGETLSDLLRAAAARRGGHEALVVPAFAHGGEAVRLTFSQLDARADELARALLALGIERGEHVALWAGNVPDWVPLMFALARIGAVLVTVNTALRREEVAYLLRQSGAAAVLHTTRTGTNESSVALDGLFGDGDPAVARVRHRVWLPSAPDDVAPLGVMPGGARCALPALAGLAERGRAVEPAALAAREAACAPGDVVNIQYTSGTTGFPKGVMLSHANVLMSGRSLSALLRTTCADRLAMIVPLFHCFGCVVCVLGAYVRGAALLSIPQFEPGAALALLEEERATIVHGVPTMFSAMLNHPDLPRRNIRTLRTGLMAGAPCPVPLMEAVEEKLRCKGITVTYGLTEASPGVSGSGPDAAREVRCGTIGAPLPGVETRVVDPATEQELPDGQPGELWVRGRNVMVGYHDEPAATARAVTPAGWLRTGDLCLRGADGHLRIVGRLKDIIIRGGENIAPAEIEAVLREHPDVADAAVVGVADEHFGEVVAAALLLRRGARLDPAGCARLLDGRLAAFKVPELWKAFDQFPLTGSGKVQKFKLREMFGDAVRTGAPDGQG